MIRLVDLIDHCDGLSADEKNAAYQCIQRKVSDVFTGKHAVAAITIFAKTGAWSRVEKLVTMHANDADVATKALLSQTLLYAVKANQEKLALTLLKIGVVPSNVHDDPQQRTALHWASLHGNSNLLKALLRSGADYWQGDEKDQTIWQSRDHQIPETLLTFIEYIFEEELKKSPSDAIKAIKQLDTKIDSLAGDYTLYTKQIRFIFGKFILDHPDTLLGYEIKKRDSGYSHLKYSIPLEYLQGADDIPGAAKLRKQCYLGLLRLVPGITPEEINAATACEYLSQYPLVLLQKFISHLGMQEKKYYTQPHIYYELVRATRLQQYDNVEKYLKAGVEPSSYHYSNSKTPLHWVVENDDSKMLTLLLDYKPSRFEGDEESRTPFYYAIEIKRLEVAAKLAASGHVSELDMWMFATDQKDSEHTLLYAKIFFAGKCYGESYRLLTKAIRAGNPEALPELQEFIDWYSKLEINYTRHDPLSSSQKKLLEQQKPILKVLTEARSNCPEKLTLIGGFLKQATAVQLTMLASYLIPEDDIDDYLIQADACLKGDRRDKFNGEVGKRMEVLTWPKNKTKEQVIVTYLLINLLKGGYPDDEYFSKIILNADEETLKASLNKVKKHPNFSPLLENLVSFYRMINNKQMTKLPQDQSLAKATLSDRGRYLVGGIYLFINRPEQRESFLKHLKKQPISDAAKGSNEARNRYTLTLKMFNLLSYEVPDKDTVKQLYNPSSEIRSLLNKFATKVSGRHFDNFLVKMLIEIKKNADNSNGEQFSLPQRIMKYTSFGYGRFRNISKSLNYHKAHCLFLLIEHCPHLTDDQKKSILKEIRHKAFSNFKWWIENKQATNRLEHLTRARGLTLFCGHLNTNSTSLSFLSSLPYWLDLDNNTVNEIDDLIKQYSNR